MRPVWPQKFYISLFLFKYHIPIAFRCMRLFRGLFEIDLALFQKKQFGHIDLWPQYNFEANEIILGAKWQSMTIVTPILRTMISDSPLLGNCSFCGYLPNLDYITMELSMEVWSKKNGTYPECWQNFREKDHLLQNIIFNNISQYKWFYKSVI